MSFDRNSAAAWMTRAATATFGAALAIGAAPWLQRAAAPGELPGALPAAGLSPSGPLLQFALVLLSVIVFAVAGNFVAPRLAGVRWATVSYWAALLSSPLPLMNFGSLRHVLLHGMVAAAIVLARDLRPRFTLDDAVLLPTLLSCYFAFLDIDFGRTRVATFLRASIAVFAWRLFVGWMSRNQRPALAFALAPLALLLQMQWLPPPMSGALAVGWIAISSFVLALLPCERIAARALAFVVYPIVFSAYPLVLLGINAAPHVDFFEDGHDLVPASEMIRGETPYADILPTHGFLADGGFDFAAIKLGARDLGQVLRVRRVIAVCGAGAVYFVALAATGSSAASCLAVLLAFAFFPASTFWWRIAPSLLGLAACTAAVRLRSERWLVVAGAAFGLALLTSLDFAAYTGIVALIVIARWPRRMRAATATGAGFLVIIVPAMAGFAIGGFMIPFIRETLEVVRSGRLFVSGPFVIPDCLRSPSALIWQLPNPRCLSAVFWVLALLLSAAGIARSPARMRRDDAVWVIGMWLAAAGFAWAERQHGYYEFALVPFIVGGLFRFRRHRTAVAAMAIALILLARPFTHLFDVATPLRRTGGLTAEGWVAVPEFARSGDALFDPRIAGGLHTMQSYVASQLKPNETFFDFDNAALLYYLFDRDCPIPQIAVPFYEEESEQRKVIAALERNEAVRAALIEFPGGYNGIDGVANSERAPLVWRYLQEHFAPAFNQDGVVIWKRR